MGHFTSPRETDMRIVVLDGYALNPGDLSWEPLAALGDFTVHDRTPPAEMVARARAAEILLTNKTEFPGEVFGQLAGLRYIGVLATGYNVVDVAAARRHGVVVTNVPTYGTATVAQFTLAHLLNLAVRIGPHVRSVDEGRWPQCPDFCYWDFPLIELAGQTMGIVGLGQIGRAVAALCQALGMKVQAYSVPRPPELPAGVRLVGLDDVFSTSDAISLHCPLTPDTRELVNAHRLGQMRPTAFLINTARGGLIDEAALAEALHSGRIAGAGLDVLSTEPPRGDNPLLAAPNCYVTPHIAWATRAARQRLLNTAVANVVAFLSGQPQNVVN
jgi:glycerate dehydrogenase